MSSEEFLQDYVEEVREHLQDMEKSLLVLEQEGTNREQMAQVFRAAHSIKGASAYMGFEGLANLTHELESLISEVQQSSRAIPSKGISLLLECVDLLSKAVDHVKKKGAEPPMDASFIEILRSAFTSGGAFTETSGGNGGDGYDVEFDLPTEIDAFAKPPEATVSETTSEAPVLPEEEPDLQSPIQEEDEELLAIFIGSFRDNYSKLLELLNSCPGEFLDEIAVDTAEELIGKLISSAQYMDYQPIVTYLVEWEKFLQAARGGGLSNREAVERLESCGLRMEALLPGLEISSPLPPESSASEATIQEEDEELFSIYLGSVQQNIAELAGIIFSPGAADRDLMKASELTGGLIQSSHYMDYEQVVEPLSNWNESLLAFDPRSGDVGRLQGLFSSLMAELERRLPGFKRPDLSEKPSAAVPLDSLEDEIDSIFDAATDFIPMAEPIEDPDTSTLTDADFTPFVPETPVEVAPQTAPSEEREKGVVRPDPPQGVTASKTSGGKPAVKERAVAYAEDVPQGTSTLRVDAQKVDMLLNQVGELVVTRSEFIQTSMFFRDVLRDLTSRGLLPKSELRRLRLLGFRLNESTQSLGRVANDLQSSVMRVRMLPIFQLFQRFPRVVRDQALKLGKKVELTIEGGETEIDKRVLEQMNDPIVQFLRNAIVHGIESPEERKRAGKPEAGIIRLSAYHAGDYVAIEIEDDGRGIDTRKLRQLLHDRKEITRHEVDALSDQEIMYSIFMPGISTYEKVDGAAGRGVGLDVVKENVESMNGSVEVESIPGQGTRFLIRIPLTVAIIKALLVREADQVFTLPLTSVTEILRYSPETTHSIEGFRVITLRGKTIPLVDLCRLMNLRQDSPESSHRFVVIVSTSFREVGLIVDGLVGEREVVIKSIENGFHPIEGFSGATILGDGRVSLIVDVSALLRMMKNSSTAKRIIEDSSGYLH